MKDSISSWKRFVERERERERVNNILRFLGNERGNRRGS